MSTTAPERIDNATLIAVATLFAVTVGAIGLVGVVVPGARPYVRAGIAVCIAVYAVFGAVVVRRAGKRL
jgi:ABC-type Fe3+-siderophore transport system permease subunit